MFKINPFTGKLDIVGGEAGPAGSIEIGNPVVGGSPYCVLFIDWDGNLAVDNPNFRYDIFDGHSLSFGFRANSGVVSAFWQWSLAYWQADGSWSTISAGWVWWWSYWYAQGGWTIYNTGDAWVSFWYVDWVGSDINSGWTGSWAFWYVADGNFWSFNASISTQGLWSFAGGYAHTWGVYANGNGSFAYGDNAQTDWDFSWVFWQWAILSNSSHTFLFSIGSSPTTVSNAANRFIVWYNGQLMFQVGAFWLYSSSLWGVNNRVLYADSGWVINAQVNRQDAPTIAPWAGAGLSSTVSIAWTELNHQVSALIGTLPTGSNAVIATITVPWHWSGLYPVITPANAATALLSGATMVYAIGASNTTYTIRAGATALTPSTTYLWNITMNYI